MRRRSFIRRVFGGLAALAAATLGLPLPKAEGLVYKGVPIVPDSEMKYPYLITTPDSIFCYDFGEPIQGLEKHGDVIRVVGTDSVWVMYPDGSVSQETGSWTGMEV